MTSACAVPEFSSEWRRALDLLARSDDGCTASLLSAHGFASEIIAGLVDSGLVACTTERILTGQRTVIVTRFNITDSGRAALAR